MFNIYKELILSIICLFLIACGDSGNNAKESVALDSTAYLLEGKMLTQRYCQSCHLYAPPDLLPKSTWQNDILPSMGAFYGIYEGKSRKELLETGEAKKKILASNIYPEEPTMDSLIWQKIKKYIIATAPNSLSIPSRPALELKNVFAVSSPEARISPPMSTMAQFGNQSGLIYHGDVKKDYSTINIFDPQLGFVQSLAMRSPAVKIREKDGELWALLMGSFTSTDAPSGSVVKVSKENSTQYNKLSTIIEGLQRPVDIAYADLDNDGDEDMIVAQFGNWTGRLEWFENDNEKYIRHPLLAKTGPTKIIVEDLNEDGLEDILTMITQADESVYALINKGGGEFQQKRLLQMPPTYGSLNFEYVDMDADGIKDIVHVTGDNADYQAILKPYHGIRIFKGLGNLKFQEEYFYPIHGAYKAIPSDFDGDGDYDIAVISFFPDYATGATEALMMLENTSEDTFDFTGFTLPGYDQGRWDVMDSGDIDNDGDSDLILGSFVVSDPYGKQAGVQESVMMKGPMVMLLTNNWAKD